MDTLLSAILWLFSYKIQIITVTQYERPVASIDRIWGQHSNIGRSLAYCETKNNPSAVNHTDAIYTGFSSWGLFQLNREYDERLLNFQFNTQEAYKLFKRRGTQPWQICSQKLGLK